MGASSWIGEPCSHILPGNFSAHLWFAFFNFPWEQIIPQIGIVAEYEEGAEGAEDKVNVIATSEDQM